MDKYMKIFLIVTTLVVVGILVVYFSAMYKVDKSMEQADDPLVILAFEQAYTTVDTFMVLAPQYPDHAFVRYYATDNNGDSLLVWGTVTNIDGNNIINYLFDEYHGRLSFTNNSISTEQIADWLIELPDGNVRGGYSTQAIFIREMQEAETEQEIAKIDSQLNLFLDPLQ